MPVFCYIVRSNATGSINTEREEPCEERRACRYLILDPISVASTRRHTSNYGLATHIISPNSAMAVVHISNFHLFHSTGTTELIVALISSLSDHLFILAPSCKASIWLSFSTHLEM
jgi:hypothetical protein